MSVPRVLQERAVHLMLAEARRLSRLQAGPLHADPEPDSAATLTRRLEWAQRDALDFAIACGAAEEGAR